MDTGNGFGLIERVKQGQGCPTKIYVKRFIIVGRNAAGKLLVCHCSSGSNNVVVTEFSASGFIAVGRPDIFSPS